MLKPSNGYHMDGTGSFETNIYLSGALVTVDDVRPIYPPQTFDINGHKYLNLITFN